MIEELVNLLSKHNAEISMIIKKSHEKIDNKLYMGHCKKMFLHILNNLSIEVWGNYIKQSYLLMSVL